MQTIYTFWKLINEYSIVIPIIQRDYAQGRTDDATTEIRENLLQNIYNALIERKELDFDFVYGSERMQEEGKSLLPLDGQQRLTTQFLLHWYLAMISGKLTEDVSKVLSRFSYSTRTSSTEFCSALACSGILLCEDDVLSKEIQNSNWYFKEWDNDPTIKAMLVMLDSINDKFFDAPDDLFDYLVEDNCKIVFSFRPLEDFELTDDLYIKMNARGKMLSDFENFKARFMQHLKEKSFDYKRFESSIDNKWVDLLWGYRADNNTIDDSFMNLFKFLTEMIYAEYADDYDDGASPFNKKRILPMISEYDSSEKVELLFDLLDLWSNKSEIDTFVDACFSSEYTAGKVRLFETERISDSCIKTGKISLTSEVLLYLVMRRVLNFKKKQKTDKCLVEYIRVVRNFIARYRQRNPLQFSTDFRFGRQAIPFVKYILNGLVDAEDVYDYILNNPKPAAIHTENYLEEQRIARLIKCKPNDKENIYHLQDIDSLKCNIWNFIDWLETQSCNIANDIIDIFEKNDYRLVARALLTVGDYGYTIGNSYWGIRKTFGNSKEWYTLLTTHDKKYSTIFCDFLASFYSQAARSSEEAMEKMIAEYLETPDYREWAYYLIRYPSILQGEKLIYNFSDNDSKCFDIHKLNGITLNGYHIRMQFIEIARQLPDSICRMDNCWGQNIEEGSLVLNNGIKLTIYSTYGAFSIENSIDDQVQEVIDRYNELDLENYDYVQRGVALAKMLYELPTV